VALCRLGFLHYEDHQAEVHRLVVGPLDNNVFVLRCKHTGAGLLVDAANEPDKLLEVSQRLGVFKVVSTHGHWDHVQAVPQMRAAGYHVGVGGGDAHMLPSYDFVIEDNMVLEVGRLSVLAVATPGHTPGSMCFVVQGSPVLFSGDTLFPGGPGNTRSREGNFSLIIRSVQDRLFRRLPDETVVMPGHGRDTTIGAESPHLDEWVKRGW